MNKMLELIEKGQIQLKASETEAKKMEDQIQDVNSKVSFKFISKIIKKLIQSHS